MSANKVAFLFPGQGAQAVGMGRQLLESSAQARQLFAEAAEVLGYDLAGVCLNGPAERLNSTVVSQPAIFVASIAALESLLANEPDARASCAATAGLSLGEYTALVFAGVMSFRDGLRVVKRRGEAMQAAADATPSGMVSVIGAERSQVEQLCQAARGDGTLQPANYLCPSNIVVSGSRASIETLETKATGIAKTVRLAVAGAFHTQLMKPADQAVAEVLQTVPMITARVPVWSNVDALPHTEPAEIRGLLVRQVVEPVLWEQTLRNLLSAEIEHFVEIGPGKVLAGLLKRVNRKIECRNVFA